MYSNNMIYFLLENHMQTIHLMAGPLKVIVLLVPPPRLLVLNNNITKGGF